MTFHFYSTKKPPKRRLIGPSENEGKIGRLADDIRTWFCKGE